MKVRRVHIAFVALILGLVVSYGVYGMLRYRTQGRTTLEKNVVIAAHDLQMEMTINDEDIEVGSRLDALPPGCVLDKAQVVGQSVVLPMPKGSIVCLNALAPVEEASFTGPAMRAVWVPISKFVGVGFLQTGARVDVLVASAPRSGFEEQTKAVLKNVLVIAVDQRQSHSEGKGLIGPVALLVSADDAEKLDSSQSHARIMLSNTKALGTK